ncbi:putative spermidine/putrescine transport system substrate-binding protein [Paraburkholderia bannensis]|uniref:Putative spermidine/putrescine transport system substrate-binding protein n=1 Tax=Paraburkholderia bannensis TaxID=765414 RepID=A0A7W9U4D2_9BURK|nr:MULTISPECIES: ABC transporter substrate-binding protein [Paraburkholderia]MBB3261004.1 putative spermidine/putrescine transport system substrate-binding protein [Paraburkholderia sp. WP4_3_2]MBB6106041.1 putative spermidine/putrescine transport system substrate-binding protein [Paraburkholderia bannensis]
MSSRWTLYAAPLIAAGALMLAAAPALAADPIVFTSWGGTTQASQQKNWAQPFAQSSGINVLMDGPTDYGKFKAMVESGNVNWDVVDVEGDFAYAAAKDGLIEPIDYTVVKKDELDPRFSSPQAVGSFYYSFVLGYNKTAFKGAQPSTWADLFDTKKFPGKRTFYKWSAPGVLEIALLADGVPASKLYPLDLDRAFKKLDTIKSDIVWWSGGAQSQQLLASGEASMGMFWNGRLHALQATGVPAGISWNQNLTAADMLVIPKGAKHRDEALKFLAAATSPQAQAKFATDTGYAPINVKSAALMTPAVAKTLPDQYTQSQINLDMKYWAANRDAIAKRWYAWQAK